MYEVQPESAQGRTKILHRNLLLPCDFISGDNSRNSTPSPEQPRQRVNPKHTNDAHLEENQPAGPPIGESDDEDDELPVIVIHPSPANTTQEATTCPPAAEPEPPVDPAYCNPSLNSPAGDTGADGVDVATSQPSMTGSTDHTLISGSQDAGSEEAHRPTRSRHPPVMLTYDTLGTPSSRPTMLNAVHVPEMIPMGYQYPQQPVTSVPPHQQFL